MTADAEQSPIMIKSTTEHHELGELGTESAKCYTKCSRDIQNTVAEPLLPLAIRRYSLTTDQRWQLQKPKKRVAHTLLAHIMAARRTCANGRSDGTKELEGTSHFRGHSHGAYMREG